MAIMTTVFSGCDLLGGDKKQENIEDASINKNNSIDNKNSNEIIAKDSTIKLADLIDEKLIKNIENNIGYNIDSTLGEDYGNCSEDGSGVVGFCKYYFTENKGDISVLKLTFHILKAENKSKAINEYNKDDVHYKLADGNLTIKNITLAKKYHSDFMGGLIKATKNNFTFSLFYKDGINEDYLISVMSDLGSKL